MMLGLLLLLTAITGIVAFYYPLIGLIILIAAMPFDFPVEVGLTVYSNQLLLLMVATVFFIKSICQNEFQLFIRKKWLLILLPFFVATALSMLNAHHFINVIKQAMYWSEIVIMAWLAAITIKNREDMEKIVMTMIIIGVITSLIGIIQTLAGPQAAFNTGKELFTIDQGQTMRAYGSLGHPNQLAGYLILLIPITFIQFVESTNRVKRSLLGLGAIVICTALILTFSRGGWLAIMLVGIILIYLNIPKKMAMIVALVAALSAVVFILNYGPLGKTKSAVMERVVSFAQPEKEDSVNFRGVCYQTGFKMFQQHPWLGFGAGNYQANINKYFNESYYAWEAINKHIHNWYLQLLIEVGLIGLLAFLWIVFNLFKRLINCWLQLDERYEWQHLSGVMAAITAFLIHNLFDVLVIYARGIHFGLVIGIGLAICYQIGTETNSQGEKR